MGAADLLYLAVTGLFFGLALLPTVGWVHTREREKLKAGVLFWAGACGFLLTSRAVDNHPWLTMPGLVCGILQPGLLAWLLAGSRRLPRWLWPALGAGTGLAVFDILVVWRPMGPLTDDKTAAAVLPLVYFAGAQLTLAVILARAAKETRGISRWRWGLIAAGAALTVCAISLISLLETELVLFLWRTALTAAALCIYLAFAPPTWLRHLWRASELYRFVRERNSLPVPERAATAPAHLCRAAVEATGGTGAIVALWDESHTHLLVHAADGWTVPVGLPLSGAWGLTKYTGALLPVDDLPAALPPEAAAPGHVTGFYRVPVTTGDHCCGLLLVCLSHRPLFRTDDLDLLILLAEQTAGDLLIHDCISGSLEKYVDRTVARRVLADPSFAAPGGHSEHGTVLFADVRRFTGWAEVTPPKQVVEVINLFLSAAVSVAAKHGGIVTQLTGDGLMVMFLPDGAATGHATRATNAAEEIIDAARRIRHRALTAPLAVGCGVNTGDIIVGNIGCTRRVEYTAMGDAVNVARRLTDLAGDGEVLIGATTGLALESMAVKDLGLQPVRNRREPIRAYRLLMKEESGSGRENV